MRDVTHKTVQGIHVTELIKEGISVISAHTNLDIAADGVSDAMAETLGLIDVKSAKSSDILCVWEVSRTFA